MTQPAQYLIQMQSKNKKQKRFISSCGQIVLTVLNHHSINPVLHREQQHGNTTFSLLTTL
jgi:hypothetical protein